MTVEIPNFRGLPQSDDGTYLQSRVLHGLYFSHFQAKGAICDRGSSSQQQQSLPSCFSLEPFPANLVHRWTNPSPNDCRTCYAHGETTFTRKSLKYCQVFTKILQLPIVRLENRINLIFFSFLRCDGRTWLPQQQKLCSRSGARLETGNGARWRPELWFREGHASGGSFERVVSWQQGSAGSVGVFIFVLDLFSVGTGS